jgi:lysozyme
VSYRDQLRFDLRRDEGEKLKAYPDPLTKAEPWTIGVGHTGPEVHEGMEIEPHESSLYLEQDIADAELDARKLLPHFDGLSEARQRAMVNMAFNLGYRRLAGFSNTIRAINEGRWADAAKGMRQSLWARQVGPRAERLAVLMEKGV